MNKKAIHARLAALVAKGILRSYHTQGDMPGVRWNVEPTGGISERSYTTAEIRIFLDGISAGEGYYEGLRAIAEREARYAAAETQ